MRKIALLSYCYIVIFSSCDFFQKKEIKTEEKPIAKVFEKFLFASDLQGLIAAGTTAQDSLEIVNSYIDKWVRKNLVLHTAEQKLTDEQKNIEKQMNDYRESLLIFLYEKAIVNQKLDTVVNENEVRGYYEKYKTSFALKNNLVKIKFIIAKKESPKIDSVKYWLKSPMSDKFLAKLNDFCSQYSTNYSLSRDQWLSMDDLTKQIPFKNENQENYLKYMWADKDENRIVELKDAEKMYVANIREYKLKGDPAPLSYIADDIKKIIVNKRKLSLVKKIYEDIYQDALKKGNFEIYK